MMFGTGGKGTRVGLGQLHFQRNFKKKAYISLYSVSKSYVFLLHCVCKFRILVFSQIFSSDLLIY